MSPSHNAQTSSKLTTCGLSSVHANTVRKQTVTPEGGANAWLGQEVALSDFFFVCVCPIFFANFLICFT